MSLEYCFRCGDPTGRAGRGDDSIYIGDEGPFCEECYSNRNLSRPSYSDVARAISICRGEPGYSQIPMDSELIIAIGELRARCYALHDALEKIKEIRWGNDGDCGAMAIIDSVL